jgi:hypothetical protein
MNGDFRRIISEPIAEFIMAFFDRFGIHQQWAPIIFLWAIPFPILLISSWRKHREDTAAFKRVFFDIGWFIFLFTIAYFIVLWFK